MRCLHKEKSVSWRKPIDPDLDRIKIAPDKEPKYKVETYSREEIGILWQYASHFERRLLLLALNCGFSISEIGNLDWKELDFSVNGVRCIRGGPYRPRGEVGIDESARLLGFLIEIHREQSEQSKSKLLPFFVDELEWSAGHRQAQVK